MKNKGLFFILISTISLSGCSIVPVSISSSSMSTSDNTSSNSNNTSSSESSESSLEPSSNSGKTSEHSSSSSSSSTSSSSASSSNSSSSSIPEEKSLAELFFDPSTKIEFIMDFSSDALDNLSSCGETSNTKYHDVYHPCTLTVKINDETTVIPEVGARMKGNTSRRSIFEGPVNFKLSFNQTFEKEYPDDPYCPEYTPTTDEKRKDRLFLDEYKKLDLKWNKNRDNTFTKELYANHILESEGVMTQKINMCKVTVKQDGMNLAGSTDLYYHVYETVDKPFLKRRLASKATKGDLYKSAWPANLNTFERYGVEDNYNDQHYVYNLKTNESDSNHSALANCIGKINQTGAVTTKIKQDIESAVDIDYLLRYSACMWVIGNPDDFRYNDNNTYFYFNSDNDKLYLIPYDNDRCFGIMEDWYVDLSRSSPTDKRNAGGGQSQSHLLWRTILDISKNNWPIVSEWQERYLEYCDTFAHRYLDVNKFRSFTSSFALKPSNNIDDGGSENQSFAYYASNKLGTL